MKIQSAILFFLLFFSSLVTAGDHRISASAQTKHEAFIKAQRMLPNGAIIKSVYYSGASKRHYCFILYSRK